MISKSIAVSQRHQGLRALEGHLLRIWGRSVPSSDVSSALRALVVALSGELVHLDDIDRSFIQSLRDSDDWFEKYCLWSKKVNPLKYADRENGCETYLATATLSALLRKYEGPLATSVDPRQGALDRFHLAEKLCKATNRRLRHYRNHFFRPLPERIGAHAILDRARRKIEKWLGSSPDLTEMAETARHGPGGNLSTGRPFVTPYYKFGNNGSPYKVGRGAWDLSRMAIATSAAWSRAICCEAYGIDWKDAHMVSFPPSLNWDTIDEKLELADYNKVTFVPKDAFTMRSIAIEPDMNIYLQLGVGGMLRRRLKAAGCDLDSQDRNQALAWLGSVENSWYDPVTVDMSMASDTVALELVRELLPPDWFWLLYRLRSPKGMLDGRELVWEKFSSMGNGYTFELESLIFYALAQSVQDELGVTEFFRENGQHAYEYLGVYGDDIVIPKVCWPKLREILKYCGFQVNWDKSFVDGPFRESCGKDWWNGRDVRPLFLTSPIKKQGDLVKVANGVDDYFRRHPDLLPRDTQFSIMDLIGLDGILRTHLRGVGKGMHSAYLNFPEDQVHVSALATFDRDYQAFKHPAIHETAIVYRGRGMWRYVQFLYNGSSRKGGQSSLTDTVIRQRRPCPLSEHLSTGGSASEVVRSGATKPKITYRTM